MNRFRRFTLPLLVALSIVAYATMAVAAEPVDSDTANVGVNVTTADTTATVVPEPSATVTATVAPTATGTTTPTPVAGTNKPNSPGSGTSANPVNALPKTGSGDMDLNWASVSVFAFGSVLLTIGWTRIELRRG